MNDEIWKLIPNYSNYEITKEGRIRNRETLIELKIHYWKNSYPSVRVKNDEGKSSAKAAHLLVSDAFLRTCKRGEMVHHKDRNKFNFKLSNLEIKESVSAHLLLHRGKNIGNNNHYLPELYNYEEKRCSRCGKKYKISPDEKRKGAKSYCTKKCHNLALDKRRRPKDGNTKTYAIPESLVIKAKRR